MQSNTQSLINRQKEENLGEKDGSDEQFLQRLRMFSEINRENIDLKVKIADLDELCHSEVKNLSTQNKRLRVQVLNYERHIEKLFRVCQELIEQREEDRPSRSRLPRQSSLNRSVFSNYNQKYPPPFEGDYVKKGIQRLEKLLKVQEFEFMQQKAGCDSVLDLQRKHNSEVNTLQAEINNLLASNVRISDSLRHLKMEYEELHGSNAKLIEEREQQYRKDSRLIIGLENENRRLREEKDDSERRRNELQEESAQLKKQLQLYQEHNQSLEIHNTQILEKDLQKVKHISKLDSEIQSLRRELESGNFESKTVLQSRPEQSSLTTSENIAHLEAQRKFKLTEEQYHQMKRQCGELKVAFEREQQKCFENLIAYRENLERVQTQYQERIFLLEQRYKSEKTEVSKFEADRSSSSRDQKVLQAKLFEMEERCENLEIQLSMKNSEINALQATLSQNPSGWTPHQLSNPTSKQTSRGNLPVESLVVIQSKIDFLEEEMFKRIKNYHQMQRENLSGISQEDPHYQCKVQENELKKTILEFQNYVEYLERELQEVRGSSGESQLGSREQLALKEPSIALDLQENKSEDIVMPMGQGSGLNQKHSPIIELDNLKAVQENSSCSKSFPNNQSTGDRYPEQKTSFVRFEAEFLERHSIKAQRYNPNTNNCEYSQQPQSALTSKLSYSESANQNQNSQIDSSLATRKLFNSNQKNIAHAFDWNRESQLPEPLDLEIFGMPKKMATFLQDKGSIEKSEEFKWYKTQATVMQSESEVHHSPARTKQSGSCSKERSFLFSGLKKRIIKGDEETATNR